MAGRQAVRQAGWLTDEIALNLEILK